MSVPAKQIRHSESFQPEIPEAELLVSDLRAGGEAPHYGLLALLTIALFAVAVSQLDRMAAAPHHAPATILLSAR